MYDFYAASNLARYFREAGLGEVRTQTFLAHGERLDHPPFWHAFLVQQIPLFVHAGLLTAAQGEAFVADLEALEARGDFRASFVKMRQWGTTRDHRVMDIHRLARRQRFGLDF